jgi:acyl carrier protein phosphodiesterase
MNYLAHLYLADGPPGWLVGALLGDFYKGDPSRLPDELAQGVRLHRMIDAYTDHHPVVGRTIHRLAGRWGRFAGIVVDVLYDHVLAQHWSRYHRREGLRQFADRAYDVLAAHQDAMPKPLAETIVRLRHEDRLMSYASETGIQATLAFVADRVRRRMPERALPLEQAIDDWRRLRTEVSDDFHEFFPELISYAVQHQQR